MVRELEFSSSLWLYIEWNEMFTCEHPGFEHLQMQPYRALKGWMSLTLDFIKSRHWAKSCVEKPREGWWLQAQNGDSTWLYTNPYFGDHQNPLGESLWGSINTISNQREDTFSPRRPPLGIAFAAEAPQRAARPLATVMSVPGKWPRCCRESHHLHREVRWWRERRTMPADYLRVCYGKRSIDRWFIVVDPLNIGFYIATSNCQRVLSMIVCQLV